MQFSQIINLGAFEHYVPNPIPDRFSADNIFMRRVSDGADWYLAFAHNPSAFASSDVIACVVAYSGKMLVQAATRAPDVQCLPVMAPVTVLVIRDAASDFDVSTLAMCIYDLGSGSFTPFPVAPPPTITSKKVMWDRMSDEEAAVLDAVVTQAPAKLRNTFASAQYIDHADALFGQLRTTIAVALGDADNPNYARADEILAPT